MKTWFQSRHGHSLLELMVVISVSSTLMLISVGWIHQSMSIGSKLRLRQRHHRNLLTLSRQLRDDVQQGDSISIVDETQLLIAGPDGRSVIYQILPARISYRLLEGEKTIALDSFEFGPRSQASWNTDAMPRAIELFVNRKLAHVGQPPLEVDASTISEPPADLQVLVAVGRWNQCGLAMESP